MKALTGAEPWMADAVCRQTDPEVFFPEMGGSTATAKRICTEHCPVVAQCLAYALEHNESGVWGGTSEKQRKKLRQAAA